MPMLDPPHPGEVIRELCLEPLGLTVTAAAKGARRHAQVAVRVAERPRRDFPGDGVPPVPGVWGQPGKLVAAAVALQFGASAKASGCVRDSADCLRVSGGPYPPASVIGDRRC